MTHAVRRSPLFWSACDLPLPWSERLRCCAPTTVRCLVLVALLLLMCRGGAARAQDVSTGALSGVVTDPSGAAVAGAFVEILEPSADRAQSIATDRAGEFFVGELPPAIYGVRIRANGFDELRIAEVTVQLGRTTRLAPTISVATQMQTITVPSEQELPAFDSPVNADVSPSGLALLPLDGRRFQSFASLTPLVSAVDAVPDGNAAETNGSSDASADSDNVRLAVRGLDPMQNQYALDGLSLKRAFDGDPRGGSSLPFTVAQEGVREFGVRAVGPGSSMGRDVGGSVNTVTRRGETKAHGSAFLLLRNSGIGAANPFAISTHYNSGSPTTVLVKPLDIREQFGGSVGGPLLGRDGRRRVFGFVAAEGQRRSFPAISSPSDPNFYNLSAIQVALLASRGVTPTATAKALSFLDGLSGPVARRADELALLPRIDWQPAKRSSLALEWARVRFRSPSGQRSASVVPVGRASFGDLTTHTDSALLHGTAALSPRWLAEVHAQYSRDAAFAEVPPPLSSEPQTGPAGTAPEVSIAGAFSFGNAAALGARRLPEERRSEAAAQASFNGHANTLSFEADVSFIDDRVGSRSASSGAYDYTSGATNGSDGGLVDFITDYTYSATSYPNGGCPSIYATVHLFCFRSFTQAFGTVPETRFHTTELSAFVGDSWRATRGLRLSAGVQYEYNRLPPPQHPNPALDAVLLSLLNGFGSTSNTPAYTSNFAPHLGIAYAPSRRTVVRVGYALHYGAVPGRTLQASLENTAEPTSQARLRLTPRTVIDPSCASAGTNFGYPATYNCTPFGPLGAAGAVTVFARSFQVPFVQTGEFSITHEIGRGTSLSGSYILGLNRHLANTVDLNIAPSTSVVAFQIVRNGIAEPGASNGQVFHVPSYTSRLTSLYGPVTAILSNGTGTYNAMALQIERRAARGLTARASWTYSKALDNVRSAGATPNENAQFDPFDALYDRAASSFNRAHRVIATAVWQPQTHGSRAVRRTANGWSVAPVFVATSGRPYSYNIVGGSSLAGGRDSLNGSGGATYLPSVGRNTLRLPWTENIDLRLARSFAAGERLHIRLSAEAFNLLNHVNVTAVQQRAFLPGTAVAGVVPLIFQDAATIAAEGLTTRAFGVPSSSSDSPARERRLQAGLRLEW